MQGCASIQAAPHRIVDGLALLHKMDRLVTVGIVGPMAEALLLLGVLALVVGIVLVLGDRGDR
jgi:hypothetical protein